MKFVIVGLFLFASLSAQAEPRVLTQYSYGYRMTESSGAQSDFGLIEVTVDSEGLASLVEKKVSPTTGKFVVLSEGNLLLTGATKRAISIRVAKLTGAELETVRPMRICAKMPRPDEREDHLKVVETRGNKLRLVLGPTDCWVRAKLMPKADDTNQAAFELKERLRLVADRLLNQQ